MRMNILKTIIMKSPKYFFIFFILSILSCASTSPDEPDYFLKISGNRPYGIAFDNNGLMYMVTAPETGNGTLSKVTPDGKISEITVLEGSFMGPGIHIENNNGIFIAVGDKLLKVSPDGNTETIADGFSLCFDVKVDNNENIYAADDLKGIIYKITPEGKKDIFFKSDTTGPFVLTSIVIDSNNENLYAREGDRIIKLKITSDSTSEKPTVIIDNTKMFYMCRDNNNNIYASTIENVIKIDTSGKVKYLSQKPLKTSIGVAVGGKGFDEKSLYVSVEDGIIKLPISKLSK
jgi:DNA-binding beta-propeller fold protein YncE